MLLKKKSLYLLLLVCVVAACFLVLFLTQKFAVKQNTGDSDPSLYADFQKRHPSFESEMARLSQSGDYHSLALIAEDLLPQSTERFEVAYLRYVAAYSYVSAVNQNNDDTESLDKAISFSRDIVSDEDSYPIIKAYTLDSYDRLTFSFMKSSVSERAMKDSYFQKFSQPVTTTVNRQSFRKNLLLYAIDLYPVTNAYYKLAMIESQESAIQQFYKPIPEGKLKNVKTEQLRVKFLNFISQGDEFLKRDYNKQGLFQNTINIPEALLSRTIAAQVYFLKTGETPLGDISDLYSKAIEESEKLNPSYTRVIKKWQSDWTKNTENYKKLYTLEK